MKADILEEKGAILQIDKETYAIAPHVPGGFIDPDAFGQMVDIAEKYGAQALKVTAGQRVAIIGIREDQLDSIWDELRMSIGYAIGLCVRMVKFCPEPRTVDMASKMPWDWA
jgi:NAD(P)H-nitrite reductase large subunit